MQPGSPTPEFDSGAGVIDLLGKTGGSHHQRLVSAHHPTVTSANSSWSPSSGACDGVSRTLIAARMHHSEELSGGAVWRSCLAELSGGAVWRSCLAELSERGAGFN
ncbi:hypothetical protein B0T16DRAFT_396797 [Cercophora newfieldiana]|uniref:Uncharacterized protein n=1 Tax=Cercophora newfieldiana TaxID=92897 RepID=A0AA39YMV8_9PEZI|nr:hypothetical protein B0T16DRAFT_396797 [Cercophora newfieldiana]